FLDSSLCYCILNCIFYFFSLFPLIRLPRISTLFPYTTLFRSYKLFSERYGKQNIAYATVHNDEQTPHMHLGVVPMRDGKLQGKNVFNRQELLWLQDKFPEHMKKQGFELKRGERGS